MRVTVLSTSLMVLFFGSMSGQAHDIGGTSARVSWRDGHVEATVQLNLIHLWQRVSPKPTAVKAQDGGAGEEMNASLAQLRQSLESGIQLLVDGKPIPWTLLGFPHASRWAKIQADYAASGDDHIHFITVRVQALEARPAGANVGVVLPKELGDVLYSFVEPRSQAARPGAAVTFALSKARSTPAKDWGRNDIFSALAVVLALMALGLHFSKKLNRPAATRREG